MSSMSNYLENVTLDHTLGTSSTAAPATVYIALYTDDPTDADAGTEVVGGAYVRTAVAFAAATAGQTQNSGSVVFPTATANWGTITHIGIHDASVAGNLLYHGSLVAAKIINLGDIFQVNAGDLVISLD